MGQPPSLLIAIPTRADVRGSAFGKLQRATVGATRFWLQTHGADANVLTASPFGAHTVTARTDIALGALKEGFDWVLWMDDDALPRPDILEQLWKHEKDFICPIFFKKWEPFECCVYDLVEGDEKFDHKPIPIDPPRLVEVDACGFHTLLMHRSVIEAVVVATKGKPFAHLNGLGEDIFFCLGAKRSGKQLWCDTSLSVGHIRDIAIDADHHRIAQKGAESCERKDATRSRRIVSLWPKTTAP